MVAGTLYAGETREKIQVGNSTREMLVYVPNGLPDYAPLVISMHGMNQDAAYQKGMANWAAVADTAKFAVVYPEGIDKSWDIGGDRDTKFVEAVIEYMFEKHHINKNRVYLSGFSMGGMFTYHAAALIADKIAAFAPISGYDMGGNASSPRAIPIIHTHGTDDDVVGYSGARPYLLKWVAIDKCNQTSVYTKPYNGKSNASMEVWSNPETGVEVALLTLDGKGHWVSMDASSVMTSCEIWNFCKRYSLDGPIEAVPPRLLSSKYEDNSFDLPSSGLSLQYTFNRPILCDTVKAKIIGYRAERILRPDETGESETLTFTLAEGDVLPQGDYRVTLENVIDTCGGINDKCSFGYYIGVVDVTEPFVADTLFCPDWLAQKEQIHEGIPSGWRRVTYTNTGIIVDEQNTPNTNSSRLKYFQQGGDMDVAFYLSASSGNYCTIDYGTYDDGRLHLVPGRYCLSFNSAFWNTEAAESGMTFSLSFSDKSGNVIVSDNEVKSSGNMNKITLRPVTGSMSHNYEFYIREEGDFILSFTAASGKNAVIIGNVVIATDPLEAQKYKWWFVEALANLHTQYDRYYAKFNESEPDRLMEWKIRMEEYDSFEGHTADAFSTAAQKVKSLSEDVEYRFVAISEFSEAMTLATSLLEKYADDATVSGTREYTQLQKRVDKYSGSFILESAVYELNNAAEDLRKYAEKLMSKTAVVVPGAGQPVSRSYFSTSGLSVEHPVRGRIYIVMDVSDDGNVTVSRQVF